jgi:hypothetical protein
MRQNDEQDLVVLTPSEVQATDGGGPTNCMGTYDEDGNLIGTCTDPTGALTKLLGR